MTDDTALAVRREADLIPMIDIAAEQARLQNFRDFVHNALEAEKGHFGVIPGTKKNSLLQPGAEIIYRALECRPKFTLLESEKDWARDFAYFLVQCEVVHVTSGIVMGEATGACSTLEKATDCPTRRPIKGQADDLIIICAEHGSAIGRRAFEWGREKGEKNWYLGCSGKTPAPLARTLQTVQAIANKRAMVAAIRTVGCVSEMFSQDDELWDRKPVPAPAARPAQRPQQAPKPAARQQAAPPPQNVDTETGEMDPDDAPFEEGEFREAPDYAPEDLIRDIQAKLGALGVELGVNLSWADVRSALGLAGNTPAQIKAALLNDWAQNRFEGAEPAQVVEIVADAVKANR